MFIIIMMKYSVIIPIYNAEKTLRRCLDSLLPQLNNDIEVLLINDGSSDNSAETCKEYVEKNPCFKYFEQENAGVSAARNLGIDKAIGDYILFVDSDDYVSNEMIALINATLGDVDYDFVLFSTVIKDFDAETIALQEPFESDYLGLVFPRVSDMICKKQINAPWGKVYKRDIINSCRIRFPENCNIAEDRAFNIAYCLHIHSMKVTQEYYYYVDRTRDNSLSRTVRSTNELNQHFDIETKYLESAISCSNLERRYIDQIVAANNFCECRQVYSRAKRMKLRGADKKEIMKGIRKDCKEVNSKKMVYPKTNYCRKIYLPVKMRFCWLIYRVVMRLVDSPT